MGDIESARPVPGNSTEESSDTMKAAGGIIPDCCVRLFLLAEPQRPSLLFLEWSAVVGDMVPPEVPLVFYLKQRIYPLVLQYSVIKYGTVYITVL